MGSPPGEEGRDKDERQHTVCINHDFRLGKREVTVAQFRRFVQDTGYRTDAEKNTGGLEGCWSYDSDGDHKEVYIKQVNWQKPNKFQQNIDEHPVSCVSWYDALAYIDWLNKRYQASFRLVTEAEWEYAARSKSKLARYWGSDVNGDVCKYANVADRESGLEYGFPCDDGYRWVSPVGGNRKANAWGLHDMLGNVHEWTCSLYDKDYQGSETVCADPEDQGRRVLRGGSWGSKPRNLRLAHRSKNEPYARYYTLGFRLAQETKEK
ncbi:MAG: hypothetical protein B6D79_04475 [gamma proteobacterium symbiont of Ctena orbiculata]|nr:MAG: hypothetical protein B6D79_04475 [gamma proteobacterium symbiont of Ctena orbiculata]